MDTRYEIAASGSGIGLFPIRTTMRDYGRDYCVYGTVKGGGIYRYVIIARKKDRTLSEGAELFWKFMISQRFRNDNKTE